MPTKSEPYAMKQPVVGTLDEDEWTTSFSERANLSMRMHRQRIVRLGIGCLKRLAYAEVTITNSG